MTRRIASWPKHLVRARLFHVQDLAEEREMAWLRRSGPAWLNHAACRPSTMKISDSFRVAAGAVGKFAGERAVSSADLRCIEVTRLRAASRAREATGTYR